MNDLPIQGEHHKYCFPSIRHVRQGDWGTSCFTCAVLAMAEHEAAVPAGVWEEDSFEAGWTATVEKCLEYMTRNGGCSAEAVINVRTLRV